MTKVEKSERSNLRFYFLLLCCLFLFACESSPKINSENSFSINEAYFQGLDGCAIVYDLNAQKILSVYGENRCREAYPPCSTFKVPLAVMGFDAGVLKDEHTSYKWNKTKYEIDSWNQDQTATSWMKNSVVWYSQKITPTIGNKRIKKYLDDFSYGNRDFSSGIDDAWLTPTLSERDFERGSLLLSAYDQLAFMMKLWRNQLPANADATEKTKKITFIEASPEGFNFSGKTGTGYSHDLSKNIGWFIGHTHGKGRELIIITTFTRPVDKNNKGYAGPAAREITKKILADNGLW